MVAGLNYDAVAAPPPPSGGDEILTLTAAPAGGWTTSQHARGLWFDDRLYFGWVNGSNAGVYVAMYDPATGLTSTPQLVATPDPGDPDTHEAPGLLVIDSNHKLLVAYCEHNGPAMFIRISTTSLDTDPDLSDGFAAAVNLDASIGAFDYTYPALFQTTTGDIYLYYRDMSAGESGRISFTKSTNSGSTWSARTHVLLPGIGDRAYWCIRQTGNRIDFWSTDKDCYGSEGVVDFGHFYFDAAAGTYHDSDGTALTLEVDPTEMTLLETDVGAVLAMDGIAGTNPVVAYYLDNGDSTVSCKYARWDGAAWDKAVVFTTDHFPVDRFYGGIAIDRNDPETVYACKKSGSSTSELWRYTSADLGLTWDAGEQLTTGSGDLNASATAVEFGDGTLPIIWLRGTLVTSHDFNFGIRSIAP